jgi:hypothetical protein
MDQDLSNKIRERAYELWITNGSPEGQSEAHWLTAENEILAAPPAGSSKSRVRSGKTSRKRRA